MRKVCILMTLGERDRSQHRLIRARGASRTHILVLYLYTYIHAGVYFSVFSLYTCLQLLFIHIK